MNEPIKDFLGHELCIGDRCAYIKNERTGSKILHVGTITDIGKSTITFQDIITLNGEIKVFNGNDIVKLSESKTEFVPVEVVHGEWVDIEETEIYCADIKTTITITTETCSACNDRIGFKGSKLYISDNICPNCGAKMDIGQVET